MALSLFWNGMVMGVAIAAPVGPIGVLCIRQTLRYGLLTGLVSGLGAATADGIYGSIAGFGLSVIADLLMTHHALLKGLGGVFLCYLGVKTWLKPPKERPPLGVLADRDNSAPGPSFQPLLRAYGTTLALTLTNPATILSFTAIFAGLGLANQEHNPSAAAMLVLGVFWGSALWWLMLSSSIACFRNRFSIHMMTGIN